VTYDPDAVARLQDPQAWADAGIDSPPLVQAWWSAGFSPDDVEQWFAVARDVVAMQDQPLALEDMPAVASTWRCAGFTPAEARGWVSTLINYEDRYDVVHEARRWRAAGFTPDTAFRWRQWGYFEGEHELEFVLLFEAAGWSHGHAAALYMLLSRHPYDQRDDLVREWLDLDLGPDKTLNYVKAAVTVTEAVALERANLRPNVLESELQARYEVSTPIDPFVAMHLNHQCGLGFGMDDDDESQWPFWARHIPDLHDQQAQR
jgi:hypothetical protein